MTTKNIRRTIYLPPALDEKIALKASELGLSTSALINLAVQAGFDAISLAVNPGMKALFESQISRSPDAKKAD